MFWCRGREEDVLRETASPVVRWLSGGRPCPTSPACGLWVSVEPIQPTTALALPALPFGKSGKTGPTGSKAEWGWH